MSPELKQKWRRFLAGHWTRERPTREGSFVIAPLDGCSTSATSYTVAYKSPLTGDILLTTTWGGWFWSEPIPNMPPVEIPKEEA